MNLLNLGIARQLNLNYSLSPKFKRVSNIFYVSQGRVLVGHLCQPALYLEAKYTRISLLHLVHISKL